MGHAPRGTDDVDLRFQVLFPGYPDEAAARDSAATAGDRAARLHGLMPAVRVSRTMIARLRFKTESPRNSAQVEIERTPLRGQRHAPGRLD